MQCQDLIVFYFLSVSVVVVVVVVTSLTSLPLLHCADRGIAQWLRCYATNREVAGSIPDGVIGIFH